MTSKLVKFNKYKHQKSTLITEGLLISIRYRDKLYKKQKITNPESSDYGILLVNLKTYNGILKTSIRKAKQLYYDECFNHFKFDIKTRGQLSMIYYLDIKQIKHFLNIL